MNTLLRHPTLFWRLLLAAALVAVLLMTEARASDCGCASAEPRVVCVHVAAPQMDSWVFARSRYSHDPDTGARVAQYQRRMAVEPLPDQRAVTSGYRRSRAVLRGADGASDTTYQVQSYGNGRGGPDAEWERFHDAWRGATVAGGNFYARDAGGYGYGGPGYGYGRSGLDYGYPGYGYGHPGFGGPGVGGPGFAPLGRGPGGRRPFVPGDGYGPGHGRPDAGRLDPDAIDGYRDEPRRTPDRAFFNPGLPPVTKPGLPPVAAP